MKGFVKLYGSILTSSVWVEPDHIFRVWITMLVLADKDGLVEGTAPGLANIARVSLNDCVEALEKFKQPDPHSRSKNDDGRRIEEVDGGWRLINHQKYREMQTESQIQTAERVRRWREKQREGSVTGNGCNAPYTDTDTDTDQKPSSSSSGLVPSEYQPDLDTLLARIAKTPDASISSWVAEIRVATQGMHGPAITPQQVGEAIRAFNANGAPTNFKLFKTYLRKTEVAAKPEVVRTLKHSKPPWEIAKEREANDMRLNRDPEVHRLVNRAKEVNGEGWWAEKIREAQAQGRWVVPFVYEQMTIELPLEKKNGTA